MKIYMYLNVYMNICAGAYANANVYLYSTYIVLLHI